MRRCLNCMKEYPDSCRDRCPHCGYQDDNTIRGDVMLRPGIILQGRYIVGTVKKIRDIDIQYIGWDALFERRVMLQEYLPRYCASRSGGSQEVSVYQAKEDIYAEGLKLFIAQSRELIRLYQDPSVITCHAVFEENKTAYAVMEYQDYPELAAWAAQRLFTEQEAVQTALQAIRCLKKVRDLGLVHGMVCQESFWVDDAGGLVIKDFGSWRYISGKPGIVFYQKLCEAVDVCGVADLIWELMTGSTHRKGESPEKNGGRLSHRLWVTLDKVWNQELVRLENLEQELAGEAEAGRMVPMRKRKRKKQMENRKSLSLPPKIYLAAGLLVACFCIFGVLMATGTIHLRISGEKSVLEQNTVRVPNIMNKTGKKAKKILTKSGLQYELEEEVYSDEIPDGRVCWQSERENAVVASGTIVRVRISKGKEEQPTDGQRTAGQTTEEQMTEKQPAEAQTTEKQPTEQQPTEAQSTKQQPSEPALPKTAKSEASTATAETLDTGTVIRGEQHHTPSDIKE